MDTFDDLVLEGLVGRFYNQNDGRFSRIVDIHFLFPVVCLLLVTRDSYDKKAIPVLGVLSRQTKITDAM